MSSYNQSTEDEFRNKFDNFDSNGTGKVEFSKLKDLTKACGVDCTEAELQDYVNELDVDEHGRITKEDFIKLMRKHHSEPDSEEELKEAFQIFNIKNTGLISCENLMEVFKKIDPDIQEGEVLQLIKECDIDGDGYLNYEEFCRMVKNK